jgi:hypothetical protein
MRAGQLLRYDWLPPRQEDKQDDYEFMGSTVIGSIRDTLKDGGFARVRNNVEEGGDFIVGYKGQIYEIQEDFVVCRTVDPYLAIGSGDDVALGSLYSTIEDPDPENRILLALCAAERYNAYVRRPFVVLSEEP